MGTETHGGRKHMARRSPLAFFPSILLLTATKPMLGQKFLSRSLSCFRGCFFMQMGSWTPCVWGGSLSQKSCCHGTAYTPPCWVSSIVLCCSTELRPIHWSLELAGPAQALPRRCNKVLHLLYSNMLNISTSPHR